MLGSNPYPPSWPELPKLQALAAGGGRPGPPGGPPRPQRDVHQRPERRRGAAERVQPVRRLLLRLQLRRQEHGPDELPPRRLRARGAHLHRGRGAVRAALPGHLAGGLRRPRRKDPASASRFVTADVVVLAAGTLGSTEILLRSRDLGLPVSDRLGDGFSGNGDVLAFAYDTDQPVRDVGLGDRVPRADTAVGPTITGLIDLRGPDTGLEDALIIEDGAIPGALASVIPLVLQRRLRRGAGGGGEAVAVTGRHPVRLASRPGRPHPDLPGHEHRRLRRPDRDGERQDPGGVARRAASSRPSRATTCCWPRPPGRCTGPRRPTRCGPGRTIGR